MSSRPHITVVIPALDEEGSVGDAIDSVKPYASEILVIDGRSKDRTREIAAQHGARVIQDEGHGKGEAVRLGLKEAAGDIVVFVDADGSHDARDIPRLTGPIEAGTADLVIGSRDKGGSDELHGTFGQFLRYIGSQTIMLSVNYRWNIRLTDGQSGFRAIRRDVGRKLGLRSDLTTIDQEMLIRSVKQGYKVSEISSHEYARRSGTSKVALGKLWHRYIWAFVRDFFF